MSRAYRILMIERTDGAKTYQPQQFYEGMTEDSGRFHGFPETDAQGEYLGAFEFGSKEAAGEFLEAEHFKAVVL